MTRDVPGQLDNLDPRLAYFYHPIATSDEVGAQPRRFSLLGESWVLFRDSANEIVAFVDRCPHRGAPLSMGSVAGGTLECAYHGWRFDERGKLLCVPALGEGAKLPAKANLIQAAALQERDGVIFLAVKLPRAELLEIPEASDETFASGMLSPVMARQHAGYLADNFLDMAHFPYLHKASFGDATSTKVDPYEVSLDDFGLRVSYRHSFLNREDPAAAKGERPLKPTARCSTAIGCRFRCLGAFASLRPKEPM